MTAEEQNFLGKLKSNTYQVLMYEDEILQTLARSVIPLEKLRANVLEKYSPENDAQARDFLLLELLNWFKTEFFTWTDSPKCSHCNGKTKYENSVQPTTVEESDGLANRVEIHVCESCGNSTRFPRYNNPGKLLETRTGRCGEWANCFTLCARAVGFEARFVVDWTDHVWTEVYSEHQKRWLHCDPCENVCDTPLMYEQGWGKKLTYIIAFSKDEIVDVSFRYAKKHKDMIGRRRNCREIVLQNFIQSLNSTKQAELPGQRKTELQNRYCCELVEFLFPRLGIKPGESEGRSSGSLDWRRDRGELGGEAEGGKFDKFVLEPSAFELENRKEIHLTYRSFDDLYVRMSDNEKTYSGWASCLYDRKNIFRKLEKDWKCVYLCRKPCSGGSAEDGTLTWMFKCPPDSQVVFESVEIEISTKTFENGRIRGVLCAGDTCSLLKCNGNREIINLNGCDNFKVEIILNGGKGNHAWQHSQVFRAEFDTHYSSLSICAILRNK